MVRRVSSTAALFAAGLAVAFTAACGGGGSQDSNGTQPDQNNGGMNNAFAAYAECLQKNGVTVTIPSGGPRNRPSGGPSGFPDGQRPSGMPRPSGSAGARGGGGFPGGGGFGMQKPDGVDDATWEKAQSACASLRPSGRAGNGGNGRNAAFQNCLKEHGVTATDGRIDTNDETTKKAVETCRVLQQPQTSPSPTA